jgi:cadmium resistance protein CadD (predicted permease)
MEIIIILVAVSAFVATNLDDLFILSAFFAHPNFNTGDVVIGQYLGFLILLLISSLAYFFQLIVPAAWISILGILPVIIGIRNLLKLKKADSSLENLGHPDKNRLVPHKTLTMASVTLANGGDNLGVYIPLFAGMDPFSILVTMCTFLILVGVWCILGFVLVNNRIFKDKIENYGHIILPFVLIIVGLVILLRGVWSGLS